MNRTVVLSGMAAALGGLVLAGGCSTEVMGERRYIPAPVEETAVPMTPVAPVQQETVTIVETEQTASAELPRFDEFVGSTSSSTVEKETPSAPSVSVAPVAKGGVYVVKAGDSCYKIARAHKVSLRALMAANGLTAATASRIQIGQKLTIPEGGKFVAPQTSSKKSTSRTAASSSSSGKVTLSSDGYYIVQAGDNVPKIARKLGVKWSELMKVNNITEESAKRLQIGQKLVVPGRAPVGIAAVAVAPEQKAEDKKTADALDAVSNVLDDVKNTPPVAGPATDGGATAEPMNDAATNPVSGTTETEQTTVQEEVVDGSSIPVEIKADVTIEKFAADNKISADTFKKLNKDSLPPDGMLRTGSIVFIPSAE